MTVAGASGVTPRRSLWIPWTLAGLFGVVLLANGIMIWVAFTTWPGLETRRAYEKGLAFNRALEDADTQAALGWEVGVEITPLSTRAVGVEVQPRDRHGHVLRNAEVVAHFVRPTHAGHDRRAALAPGSDGRYGADVHLPLAGMWDVRIEVRHGGHIHRQGERVLIDP